MNDYPSKGSEDICNPLELSYRPKITVAVEMRRRKERKESDIHAHSRTEPSSISDTNAGFI